MIYISSTCSQSEKIVDVIEELASAGFRNIELSGGTKYYKDAESDILKKKKEYALNFSLHNYFPPPEDDFVLNLITDDPGIKEKTFRLVKNAVSFAKKVGSDLYTVHAGYTSHLVPKKQGKYFGVSGEVKFTAGTAMDALIESVDYMVSNTGENRFRFGIENLFPYNSEENYSLFCTPEEILRFLKYYKDQDNVGILFDLGHFNVAANYFGFDNIKEAQRIIDEFANKIFAIHVSENDGSGDDHRMTKLYSWQLEFIRNNKPELKNTPIVLEWHNFPAPDAYQRYLNVIDILEE